MTVPKSSARSGRRRMPADANREIGGLPVDLGPRELIDSRYDSIVVRSCSDYRIIHWSHGAYRMYGWHPDDVIGQVDPLETEYQDDHSSIMKELLRSGHWEGVVRQRRRDGQTIRVLTRWREHRSPAGDVDAIIEFNTDLSGAAELEGRPEGKDELFRQMVETVRDYAIFMLDPDGKVATWNAGAERIKGYSATDIIGRHFSTFYPAADVQAGKPDWELVVATDTGRFEDEGWRVRKDGSQFWANVVITALRDAGGQLRGFTKVTRDLTARREAELVRLERQRKEAEAARALAARASELERTKTEFLNLASHELRSPLGLARGYVSLLLDGSLTPIQFAEHAPIVANKLARIEAVVSEMLETARLEYDQLVLSVSDVDLGRIVREQVEAIRSSLSPSHQLNLDVPESLPPVHGDPDRLAAVAANLLDNAVKYSPEGGRIDAKVMASRHRVFFSVADEGLGIDEEDMPKLFRRFTRLHEKETANIGGTGLGLFLSREIARRHGGDIIVESRRDEGSRFTLSLPISENSAS